MAINLDKGKKINLTKQASSLKIAGIGLGWDTNTKSTNLDLDVSAILLNHNGKVENENYLIYYGSKLKNNDGRPYSYDMSVIGSVDSIDGSESKGGDDEDMKINFENIWEGITEILICVSITKYPNDLKKDYATQSLNFGQVNNCYMRVWDENTSEEIFRYDLKNEFSNEDVVEFGRFIKVDGSWEFIASGSALSSGIEGLFKKYVPSEIYNKLNFDKNKIQKLYFYSDGSKTFGPFDKDDLISKINGDTNVLIQGSNTWLKASQVPELKVYFPSEKIVEKIIVQEKIKEVRVDNSNSYQNHNIKQVESFPAIYRSKDSKVIFGFCGGLAHKFSINVIIVRIAVIFSFYFLIGWLYFLTFLIPAYNTKK
jgi:tellurium resistance protein TerD